MKLAFILVLGSFQFGAPPERYESEAVSRAHSRAQSDASTHAQASARDRSGDRWIARDKAYHFVATAVIQGAGHSLLRAAGSDYRQASVGAGVFALGVGVGKELWDRSRGRYFSWKDLGADLAGGASGAVVVRQLDR